MYQEHLFGEKYERDMFKLLVGTNTFQAFCRKLVKCSKIKYDPNKYLGDGFEWFVNEFLWLFQFDKKVGVYDYKVWEEEDTGIDGTGVNMNGDLSVVQVKFRTNVTTELTANTDHLSNLVTAGLVHKNVVMDTENRKNFRHFVFTNAKGLHWYTDSMMFNGTVSCFDSEKFKKMLDHNFRFWNQMREDYVV